MKSEEDNLEMLEDLVKKVLEKIKFKKSRPRCWNCGEIDHLKVVVGNRMDKTTFRKTRSELMRGGNHRLEDFQLHKLIVWHSCVIRLALCM